MNVEWICCSAIMVFTAEDLRLGRLQKAVGRLGERSPGLQWNFQSRSFYPGNSSWAKHPGAFLSWRKPGLWQPGTVPWPQKVPAPVPLPCSDWLPFRLPSTASSSNPIFGPITRVVNWHPLAVTVSFLESFRVKHICIWLLAFKESSLSIIWLLKKL